MDKEMRIGDWNIDPHRNLLTKNGRKVTVEQKAMEVLLFLVRRKGKVASREAIMDEVWKDSYVTEESLTRCISLLRKAFGDSAGEPRYIKTVKGKGYELIAEVSFPDQEPSGKDWIPNLNRLPALIWLAAGLFLLLVILYSFIYVPSKSNHVAQQWVKQPLTTQTGEEIHPAVAPDGSRLSYAANSSETGNLDIYTQLIGAGDPLQLTNHPADEFAPAWSPDGRYIAFMRLNESGGGSEICLIPSLGGTESILVKRNVSSHTRLSWSPDGTRIAYVDRPDPDASHVIFQIDITSGERQQLTRADAQHWGDFAPSYSPNGGYITFIASVSAGTQAIFRLDLEDYTLEQLTGSRRISGQAWSGDGSMLYYTVDQPETGSIWTLNPDNPAETEWTGLSGVNFSIADQHHILVQQNRNRYTVHETVLKESSDQILPDGPFQPAPFHSSEGDRSAVLSPNGEKAAYFSDRSGHLELWMYDYTQSLNRQLTRFEGSRFLQSPSFGTDNKTITFTSFSPDSNADIWLSFASGEPARPMAEISTEHNEIAPSWCPDGTLLIGSDRTGEWQIWKYDPELEETKQVTTDGGYSARCGPGADIYYTRYDSPGIWKYSDNQSELVIEDFEELLPRFWTIHPGGIFYISSLQSGRHAHHYNFSDNRSTRMQDIPDEYLAGIAFSSITGRLLAVIEQNSESGIYLYSRGNE